MLRRRRIVLGLLTERLDIEKEGLNGYLEH
jgi:hypothetical protein